MGDLDLIGRLTKFCDEWAKMRHTVDEIQGLHHGEERGCVLRASDIRQAADEIARLREEVRVMKIELYGVPREGTPISIFDIPLSKEPQG